MPLQGISDNTLRSKPGQSHLSNCDLGMFLQSVRGRELCRTHGVAPSQVRRGAAAVKALASSDEIAVVFAGYLREPESGLTLPMLTRVWRVLAEARLLVEADHPVTLWTREVITRFLEPFDLRLRPLVVSRLVFLLLDHVDDPEVAAIADLSREQRSAHSWHRPAAETVTDGRATRTVPMWRSARHWLAVVDHVARSDHGQAVRARIGGISVSVINAVAAALAGHASSDSGRHVEVSIDTVVSQSGLSRSRVVTARRWLRRVELLVDVQYGRGLTTYEIAAARAHHGGTQTSVASELALTVPRKYAGIGVARRTRALPRFSHVTTCSSSSKMVTKRAQARASRPTCPTTAPQSVTPPKTRLPRPLPLQRLVAGLIARTPVLGRSETHQGRFCDVVARAGIDPAVWSADDVVKVLNAHGRRERLMWPERVDQPAGYLAWRLSRIRWTHEPVPSREAAQAAAQIRRDIESVVTADARRACDIPSAEARAFYRRNWRSFAPSAKTGTDSVSSTVGVG